MRSAPGVVGLDEVGRGALAGPVVVAGARFITIADHPGIQDSKRLSPGRRQAAAAWAKENAGKWAVVEIWPETIDRINILEATRRAMRVLASVLAEPDDVVVVDAVDLGPEYPRALAQIKADERFFCVAAASNVAKVHRDGLMVGLAESYPGFEWEKNKGYGTAKHREGLAVKGPTCLHRRSFKHAPVLP